MRLIRHISGCIAAALLLLGCEENPYGPTGYQPDVQKPEIKEPVPTEKGGYAKGAFKNGKATIALDPFKE